MRQLNLKSMSAGDLIDLRTRIDAVLSAKVQAERKVLEASLHKLERFGNDPARRGRKPHFLAGKKVAPKYRGPKGETWSGRGLKPKWLAAALKDGKKIEDFLIVSRPAGARSKARRLGKR